MKATQRRRFKVLDQGIATNFTAKLTDHPDRFWLGTGAGLDRVLHVTVRFLSSNLNCSDQRFGIFIGN